MATEKITVPLRVNDVLTDAGTATIHVTRDDTGADVVAALTPMDWLSLGIYYTTFTAPALGLIYTWTATFTLVGGQVISGTNNYTGATETSAVTAVLTEDKRLRSFTNERVGTRYSRTYYGPLDPTALASLLPALSGAMPTGSDCPTGTVVVSISDPRPAPGRAVAVVVVTGWKDGTGSVA